MKYFEQKIGEQVSFLFAVSAASEQKTSKDLLHIPGEAKLVLVYPLLQETCRLSPNLTLHELVVSAEKDEPFGVYGIYEDVFDADEKFGIEYRGQAIGVQTGESTTFV
jgi:hypothetical protein